MTEGINITVQNKLIMEKRDLNVYHHSTRSAYIISHSNSVPICMGNFEGGDFLLLSIVRGPGRMEKDCWISFPSWCFFAVSTLNDGDIFHSGDRLLVRIPAGPPLWQIKLALPLDHKNSKTDNFVVFGDPEHKPDEGLEKIAFDTVKRFVEGAHRG
jgi:hypothetical protein